GTTDRRRCETDRACHSESAVAQPLGERRIDHAARSGIRRERGNEDPVDLDRECPLPEERTHETCRDSRPYDLRHEKESDATEEERRPSHHHPPGSLGRMLRARPGNREDEGREKDEIAEREHHVAIIASWCAPEEQPRERRARHSGPPRPTDLKQMKER